MPHHTPLIATIVAGLVLAFVFAAIAVRLRVSPLIGYLAAGVVVGPFTPGYVADQSLANELAEMGVILLMFGVGLHFSVRELLSVRKIAIPGALVQIGVAMLLGMGLAFALGWDLIAGFVFGLALSVASTVVLLRALQERKILDTERGKIAVGWLIVEDLVMVLALVLIPALAAGQSGGTFGWTIGLTIVKVAAFVAFMLIVGRRVIPWALHEIAHTGSRELFRLAVLAIALGVAFGAAKLFGVSFALGAFFAGMILAESPFSQRAAQETLPLRDAFAVLFFVSVGMLFDPNILLSHPIALAATVAIIVLGKSIAAYFIVRGFGRSHSTGLVISASLAQIGEFSFILATMGTTLAILPPDGRSLILAGAIISIMLNPVVFALIDRVSVKETPDAAPFVAPRDKRHIVLIGYGRVGRLVGEGLLGASEALTVVEAEGDVDGLREAVEARILIGNAANPHVLRRAELDKAKMLFVAIPNTFEAGQIVEQARAIHPGLPIIARAHSDEEVDYLTARGATRTIMGEREIARRMIADAKAAA